MSAAMRAAWRVVAPEPARRKLGYALDAVAVETLFVGGPLLLTALLAIATPVVPLVITAALLALGGVGYALTGAARSFTGSGAHVGAHAGPGSEAGGGRPRPVVLARGVLPAFVVLAAMSVGFGLLDVSLAGLAEEIFGSADSLGYLFAGIAGGSAVGGLLYGAIDWKGPDRGRLPWLLGGFGTGLVAVALLAGTGDGDPSLLLLVPVLALTGLFISPNLIVLQGVVDDTAPPARLGEAQAWLSSAVTAGAAAGNALAGKLLEDHGPPQSFAAAAVAVVGAAVLALLVQGAWRRAHDARPAVEVA
ncbi:MFS transporter [Kineococcus gynurae]